MLIERGEGAEEGAEEDEREGMAEARLRTEAAPDEVDCKLDVEKRDEDAAAEPDPDPDV
jgi:hypothetical protein